jgi:acyl-CoA synthetase (AMP-forming)/AMP-acid ligase II
MHLDDFITETAARFPDRPAVTCGESAFTYAELDARIDRTASALRNLGLVPGDRLAYQLQNFRPETIITVFAALRAGLTLVPIPVRQAPAQIAYVLQHSAARAWVSEAEFLARMEPAQTTGPEWIITVGPPADGTVPFADLPEEPARELPRGLVSEDAIGLLVYTSGTTSRPKGVAHSQRRLSYRVDLFVEEMEFTEEDATVVFFEIGRPVVFMGQVLAMLRVGGRLSLPPSGDPAAFWEAYRALGRPTYLISAPGPTHALLSHPAARTLSHTALRYFICGGDRVLPHLHTLCQDVLGKPIVELCGMTEVGFYAITPPHHQIRPGSVGRPMLSCQVRIVDEHGGETPVGEVGEILVRTPNTMVGYWNDTVGTFRAFSDLWIRSGDLGRLDADGYLWLVGRAKLMISRGGFKVAPPMVEDAIREHPAIAEACVVAQSDPVQGQIPFAFYEVRAGQADPGAPALHEWLRPRVDPASIPDAFVPVTRWPITAQGKLDRPRLTWLAESGEDQLG